MATFDFLGIYLPNLMVMSVLAVALTFLLVRILSRLGVYRVVWHAALFNISLFVIVLGLLSLRDSLWWFIP